MDRREFLRGMGSVSAAVILNALPHNSEATEKEILFLSSGLTPEELAQHKRSAIRSLVDSIPSAPELAYLKNLSRDLDDESQMYIPDVVELKSVIKESMEPLTQLAKAVPKNNFGIFIFADIQDGQPTQRMYVLRKRSETEMQFIKGYKISVSADGFGNEEESGKSPIELLTADSGTFGSFGELMAEKKVHTDLFVKMRGYDRWFIKSLGGLPPHGETSDTAAVVTGHYPLHGPNTPKSRGIRIHGSNRTGERLPDGTWKSYLDGRTGSGGCFRMSNVDFEDLRLQNFIKQGSAVRVHATNPALLALPRSLRPRRRIIHQE